MTNEISFTFPVIPPDTIEQLNQTTQLFADSTVGFLCALRTKYSSLAKLNGYIKISRYHMGDQNWSAEGETRLERDGKRVHGLLAADFFTQSDDSQNDGRYTGEQLYLTEDGWVEIARNGHWSRWQGASDYWTCDGNFADGREFEVKGGGIRYLSDEQVASEYASIPHIAETLAKSLSTLAEKIPERMARKRVLAESLQTITAQLLA